MPTAPLAVAGAPPGTALTKFALVHDGSLNRRDVLRLGSAMPEGDRLSLATAPNCPYYCLQYLDLIATARDLASFDCGAIELLAKVASVDWIRASNVLRLHREWKRTSTIEKTISCKWLLNALLALARKDRGAEYTMENEVNTGPGWTTSSGSVTWMDVGPQSGHLSDIHRHTHTERVRQPPSLQGEVQQLQTESERHSQKEALVQTQQHGVRQLIDAIPEGIPVLLDAKRGEPASHCHLLPSPALFSPLSCLSLALFIILVYLRKKLEKKLGLLIEKNKRCSDSSSQTLWIDP